MTLDPGQREQRHEARDDDGGREKDRLADLRRCDGHRIHLAVKTAGRPHAMQRAWSGASAGRRFGQMPEDVLDHDDGSIDHQTEIDGSNRQQIGGLAAQHHEAHGERQGERNGDRNDHRAAQIAEEHPLHDKYEHDSGDHVVQHGMSRDLNQVAAIVDTLYADTGRQDAAAVHLVDFGFDALDGRYALRAAPHQHDALDDIIDLVVSRDTEARQVTDADVGDVADDDRSSLIVRYERAADLMCRMDQPHSTNHGRLLAEIDRLTTDIDVGIAECGQYLRHRQSITHQFALIDGNVIGLGLAAPPGHIDDAGHRLEAALEHPIFQRFQIRGRIVGRTHHSITIDFANRTGGRDLRLGAVRQRRKL